jgi:hypothetical protein
MHNAKGNQSFHQTKCSIICGEWYKKGIVRDSRHNLGIDKEHNLTPAKKMRQITLK